jgi:hypothetical protein
MTINENSALSMGKEKYTKMPKSIIENILEGYCKENLLKNIFKKGFLIQTIFFRYKI